MPPDKSRGSRRRTAAMMAGIDPATAGKIALRHDPVVADGLKPFTVYAADADRAKAAKMPVVAIVIGGLGVGAAKTTDAIMRLPPAVTLAFTPYGSDPGKLAERARAQRHEILLQIPMEPFDYPDNDPGPQTLLTTLGAEQNSTGCTGTSAGCRAMPASPISWARASSRPTRRCSRSSARRPSAGSAIFDDGSSPRSVAPQRWRQPGDAVRQGRYRASTRCRPRPRSTARWPSSKRWRKRTRRRRRHRLGAAGLDRADRRLDQDA